MATIVAGRSRVDLAGLVMSAGPAASVFGQQWHVAEAWLTREGFEQDVIERAVENATLSAGRESGPDVIERSNRAYRAASG